MLLIPCPWCGFRVETEFTYGGDATVRVADAFAPSSDQDWYAAVYRRANPKGAHSEYWHHTHGCRQWFTVERDTVTHEIMSSEAPKGDRAGDGADE
jgi:heterotetrameric sarcosine oxidase delta subunit